MPAEVNRSTLLTTVILVGMVGVCAWSYFHRGAAANRLETDLDNLAVCQHTAEKISHLRQQKQRAQLQTKPTSELNRKIETWAGEVGIEPKRLARVEPQEPRRVGDTQYLEQVTELELMGVTLEQVVRLAQLAEGSDEGMKFNSLRISPPRSAAPAEGEPEMWNAEVALTYLIYSPKSTIR